MIDCCLGNEMRNMMIGVTIVSNYVHLSSHSAVMHSISLP